MDILGQKHARGVSELVLKSLLSNERPVCVSVVDIHTGLFYLYDSSLLPVY
jgi:hypothetical protein